MASRVLGFARETMIAGLLGAGPVADAFYAAFRFPNLFRRLFAEGAFNAAFIPLFSKELENGGRDAARAFAEQILSVLILVLLALSALAITFAPYLVGTIIAPKFAADPEKFELTTLLTRIMFPYLAAMSLVAMLSGILNAFRKYFLAALAPVLLNVVLIGILVFCWANNFTPRDIGVWMAWGVALSGLLQLGLLIRGVVNEGFPLSLRMPTLSAPVKRLLVLAVPTAIAGGITQINLLVGQIIASAQSGAIAVMNFADRLVQLPLGVIAIAIGVVLLPELSRALAAGDKKEASFLQNRSLEFGLGLTVPAAVGLFMIPLPLVALVYERGAFVRETSEITANVLAAFAIGLPSFVLIKIFQPYFYAREDMRTPMWFSGLNAVLNIVLALSLFPLYGVVGLAIATSIAGWANALGLAIWLQIKGELNLAKSTIKNTALILIASCAMAVVLYFGQNILGTDLVDLAILSRAGLVLGLIGLAAAVYFAIVILSGAIPKQDLKRLIGKR